MKFRKKPVVVEAVQFTNLMASSNQDLPEGVVCNSVTYSDYSTKQVERYGYVIRTLEGNMAVSVGDWIITGVQGEKYPCKPDIFEATYEAVVD